MPKATAQSSAHKRRHNPLEDDLLSTGVLKNREGRPSKREAKTQAEEQAYVDAKASRKILAMSRDLIDEEELQSATKINNASGPSAFDFDPSRLEGGSDQEEEFANEEAWGDEESVVEEIEVDAADLETFNRFITPSMNDDPLLTHGWDGQAGDGAEEQGPGTNLADLIMAKIAEREAMQGSGRQQDFNPIGEDYELPPKVIEVFTKYVWSPGLAKVSMEGDADFVIGLASSLPGTSPARCRSLSRSCRKYPTGRTFSKSQSQSHGASNTSVCIPITR